MIGFFRGCRSISPRKVAIEASATAPSPGKPSTPTHAAATPPGKPPTPTHAAATSPGKPTVSPGKPLEAPGEASTPTRGNEADDKGLGSMELFGADSDESDDEAALERYDRKEIDKASEGTREEYNKRNVALLLSKVCLSPSYQGSQYAQMTPEQLFEKFDEDHSGLISVDEFLNMVQPGGAALPHLNISVSRPKGLRIFRACDKDKSGEIDIEEFKMALFAVDPNSGNTLQFAPSSLLSPKDAFELFDEDGDGQLNELEFADVVEYFNIKANDAKQERLFKKYDKDKSGFIDFQEFRAMWLQCIDVEEELRARKIEIPKYTTRSKLVQLLEVALLEEEHNENQVLIEAKWYHLWQLEKIRRTTLANKAILRAQDELAAALDAAGQVYVLGTGQYDQFTGTPAARDPLLYDGYKNVSAIWYGCGFVLLEVYADREARVKPTYIPPIHKLKPPEPKPTESEHNDDGIVEKTERKPVPSPDRVPFVRRRPANEGWNNTSPPKLDRFLWKPKPVAKTRPSDADNTDNADGDKEGDVEETDELLAKFLEDRQYVRSLRFKTIHPMPNTGWLWGRQVVQATITDSIAYAVTASGQIYCWGGQNKWWKGLATEATDLATEDSDDEDTFDDKAALERQHRLEVEQARQLTARSELQKMAAPKYVAAAVALEVEVQLQNAAEKKYKRVVVYFDQWEPPPSAATRNLFLHQVLLPKLTIAEVQSSLLNRGFVVGRATKLEMIDLFSDCLDIEHELCSEEQRRSFKELDFLIKELEQGQLKPKQAAQLPLTIVQAAEKTKFETDVSGRVAVDAHGLQYAIFREQQTRLHELREEEERQANFDFATRREVAFEASVAHHRVQLEDVCPEYTPRNTSLVVDLNGVTSRALYTWGVGIHGRLGHGKNLEGVVNTDADHPTRAVFVQDVACAFDHSAALSVDGQVYVWGSAATGKLGIGALDPKYEQCALYPMLVKIPNQRRIRQVACGRAHTGAVSTQGELFMWGCANGGRLGLGDQVLDEVAVPTFVKSLAHVSCGNTHSAICTEIHSEINASIETISGGEIYVCGSAGPLMHHTPSWTVIQSIRGSPMRQVSCGFGHTAAVSMHGELYTWGQNVKACTGHPEERRIIAEPELIRAFHVAPFNLALNKRCRQSSIFNEQDAGRAVNGNRSGRLHACTHTQYDDFPWWEVDLGQPAVIERIQVWNRIDEPIDISHPRDEFTRRLFPFWILVSEVPFLEGSGKEALKAGRDVSNEAKEFTENQRLTQWVLPTSESVGRYIRIHVRGRTYMHLAEVEVFGVYQALNYVGRVSSVHCAKNVTLVVMRPVSKSTVLHDHYIKAVQADPDNAMILRQYEAYVKCFHLYGRGEKLGAVPCRLCRVSRKCEKCEYFETSPSSDLPLTPLGGRIGLKEASEVILSREPPRPEYKPFIPPVRETMTDKITKVIPLSPGRRLAKG
ncbi:regulator of chromosome condensation (RCC1) [Achlya hypogyna]|uniref:Regulator of chromosome condensation (RCC1) n=1 Tax=Achlya hypogyna TaxID=1202772 RepID=A0A1V9ZNY5_ACHHY|nr:regulator of chromosome condensation (RCC1) [Achlya hypogyna]